MNGLPPHLGFSEPAVVRLPPGQVDGPRGNDVIQDRRHATRVRMDVDLLPGPNDSYSPLSGPKIVEIQARQNGHRG